MTLASPGAVKTLRDEFPIFRHSTYLNSCSLGALSVRARARVNEYLDLWENRGAPAWYEIWWAALADLRMRYGRLVGARAGEIALHANISSALSVVGESLEYARRPKVIVTSLDFPTIGYQWMAKRARGVEVVVLESPDGIRVPLELFERAVDDRTAIVATSHVFFASGAIQDIGAIAGIAHRKGALCLIDGYQGVGQLPVDVKASGVDFYCSGGLKWLLGGTGVAFLYASPDVTPSLFPQVTGWFAHRDQFRFDTRSLEFHDDARRLETGTPPLMPVYAQRGGLEILEELGGEAIRRRTAELAEDLIELAQARGLRPRVAPTPEERTAIVMLPSDDPHRAVASLAAAGFVTDARPGHVRVSPYFYNVPDDHRALIEHLTRGR
ncbi:MAG TPA: aminotransferase class V-fold PLP-dependent enzyme [Gemmatimonadales bacterium]